MADKNFIIENGVLIGYNGKERTVVIPEGVTEIGRAVFRSHLRLEIVQLPSTLEAIGDFAFDSCARLERIHLPKSVKRIGYSAFGFCVSLCELCIEDGSLLSEIADEAFLECGALRRVTLPESVKKVGKSAFLGAADDLITINSPSIRFSSYAARDGSFIFAPSLIPSAFGSKHTGSVICGYFKALSQKETVSESSKRRYDRYFGRNRDSVMGALARLTNNRRLLSYAVEYLLEKDLPTSVDCDYLLELLADDAESVSRVISYKMSHFDSDPQELSLEL